MRKPHHAPRPRTRNPIACTLCSALLSWALLSWALGTAASAEPRAALDAALAGLRANALGREQNLAQQERLWPTRDEDQRRELASPPAVQDLEDQHRELLSVRKEIEGRIASLAPGERTHLWAMMSAVTDPRDLDALLPVAVEAAGDDPSASKTLVALAERFVPVPRSLANALGRVGGEACGRVLLDHGKRLRDGALLCAAARTGEPSVLRALVDIADGKDHALAALCFRALESLPPPAEWARIRRGQRAAPHPAGLSAVEVATRSVMAADRPLADIALEELLRSKVEGSRSASVRAVLLTQLSAFHDPSLFSFFRSVYEEAVDEPTRVAALGSMGNLGASGSVGANVGEFLLAELARSDLSVATRRSCILALGAARHRKAAPQLIEELDDDLVRAEAARSLARIAGVKLGDRPSIWMRWWRTQPEFLASIAEEPKAVEKPGS